MSGSPLRIALHADGGPGIGLGHATRAVGLAHALARRGHTPHFILPEDAALRAWIETRSPGASIIVVERGSAGAVLDAARRVDVNVLSIDSYGLTAAEIGALADALPVICFDDGARPELRVDLVVNAAPWATRVGYQGRPDTEFLLGSTFQILRPEFAAGPVPPARDRVHRVFATLGGEDPGGALNTLVAYFRDEFLPAHPGTAVDVVVGPFAECRIAEGDGLTLYRNPPSVATLMRAADVAVSAAGQTLFELACCGRPTVAILTGEDQRLNKEALVAADVVLDAGDLGPGWTSRVAAALGRCCADLALRRDLGKRGAAFVDGGGAERVVARLAARVERASRAGVQ